MAVELKIPSVGESITEVEIGEWLKAEGDRAEKDENLVVIETEKVTFELAAPVSGIVTKVLKKRGAVASVGAEAEQLFNPVHRPFSSVRVRTSRG